MSNRQAQTADRATRQPKKNRQEADSKGGNPKRGNQKLTQQVTLNARNTKKQQIKSPLLTPEESYDDLDYESDLNDIDIDDYEWNTWAYHIQQVKNNGKIKKFNQRGVFYFSPKEEIKFASTSTCGWSHRSWLRYQMVKLTTSPIFNNFILVIIFVNSIMMGAKNYLDPDNQSQRNQILAQIDPYVNTIIYAECVLKIFAMGFVLGQNSYLRDGWNVLDFIVVFSSVITAVQGMISDGPQNQGMKAFRTFRLLRPLRLVGRIKTLKTLIGTLINSLKALGATMALTCFFFIVYAIFGMTVWSGALHWRCYATEHPVDGVWKLYGAPDDTYTDICSKNSPCPEDAFCGNRFLERDPNNPDAPYPFTDSSDLWHDSQMEEQHWGYNNFDNLGSALLTVFQVTTTDGWTPMMFNYENAGSRALSWFYFISCVLICNFFILNLTVGQMMLQYEKEEEKMEKQQEAEGKQDVFEKELNDYGTNILINAGMEEFTKGDKNLIKFVIDEEDVFLAQSAQNIVQVEKSFFQAFADGQKQQGLDREHPYYKNIVVDCCLNVVEDIYFNAFILIVIIANTMILCCDKYPSWPPEIGLRFEILNVIFTAVFTCELIIKLVGLGLRPFLKDGFNIFDAVIVFTSIQGIVIELQGAGESNKMLLILRTFRCFRIFKLFKVGDLRVLVDSQLRTIPQFVPYFCLITFVFYIFALIGMNFFAGKIKIDDNGEYDENADPVREGYDTLGMSFLTIFQVLMGAEWRFIWYQNMQACGSNAAWYYVALIICLVIVMINLLMAIMLGNYDKARKFSEKRKIFDAYSILSQQSFSHEEAPQARQKGLKVGDPKFSVDEMCDIIFDDFSHHIKVHVIKIQTEEIKEDNKGSSAIVEKIKANMAKIDKEFNIENEENYLKFDEEDIDEHTKEIQNHDYSWFANSSLGIFHIDGCIRKFCMILAVDRVYYNELYFIRKKIIARNIHNQIKLYEKLLLEGAHEYNMPEKIPKELDPAKKIEGINFNRYFENFILLLILGNSILLAQDSPLTDDTTEFQQKVQYLNTIFTILFTLELVIRIIANGFFTNQLFHIEPYFSTGWNRLDFLIVITSDIDLAMAILQKYGYITNTSNMQALKSLRSLRALRPLRAIQGFPELKQVVNAFLESFQAVQNVFVMGVLTLIIFAVIGVSLFKGQYWSCTADGVDDTIKTKEDCINKFSADDWQQNDSNFDNIVHAMRTLFILTTTEGWSGVAYYGMDTNGIGNQPVQDINAGMIWYFIAFMIIGSLFIANLVVGVIIDQFNKSKSKQSQSEDSQSVVVKATMTYKDIEKIQQERAEACQMPTDWTQFAYVISHHKYFDRFIIFTVILNTFTMSIVTYQSSDTYRLYLSYFNAAFTIIFNIEMILKLISDKLKYFANKWNHLDCFIVISADLGFLFQKLGAHSGVMKNSITVFRVLRILRVAKLLQKFDNVQILLNSLLLILPKISNVLLLLVLTIYIYALIGIHMFAGAMRLAELDQYNNFDSLGRAVLSLTRYSTGEDFQEFMYEYSNTGNDCLHDGEGEDNFNYLKYKEQGNVRCGTPYSVPYFFSFVVITSWMVINLIIAAIIDGLTQAYSDRSKFINNEDMVAYVDLWQKYDPEGNWYLTLDRLWIFMADIPEPIGDKSLKESWDVDEKKDAHSYFYSDQVPNNEDKRFKVRKYRLLQAVNAFDFSLEKNSKGQVIAAFKSFTKSFIQWGHYKDKLANEVQRQACVNRQNATKKAMNANLLEFMRKKRNTIHSSKMTVNDLELCPRHHLSTHIIAGNFIKVLERQRQKQLLRTQSLSNNSIPQFRR